jgi:CubicO group peptidase (beta-lactamase class C family)
MAERAGFVPEKLGLACRMLEQEVSSGRVGAAALLVARDGAVAVERGYGRLRRDPAAPECRPDSVFLVASISKPITAMAVMKLVERGTLRLDDPAAKHLPEFRGGGREQITVRRLLCHASGLPDMLPENIELRKRLAPLAEFVKASLRTPLLFEPGTKVSYQSMGLLLAAEIVERLTRRKLDAFLQTEVFGPLGMQQSAMGLGRRRIEETVQVDLPAAGDVAQTDADRPWNWNSPYWRNLGAPWGGMHTTVGDIAVVLQAMLDGGKPVLKPASAAEMLTDQNRGLNTPWGLGWRLGPDAFYPGSPPEAFGHHGATGTLCWADPARRMVFVLFTNRPGVNDPTDFPIRLSAAVSAAAA